MHPTDLGWTPPDAGWPRARPAAGRLEWVWALGVSGLAHAAAYAALIQGGWGASLRHWPAAAGLSSIELVMLPAATPSPETGEPDEELTAVLELAVPGEATPAGIEQAPEAQPGAIERTPARLAQHSTRDDASPELPAPQLQLVLGARVEPSEPRPTGAPQAKPQTTQRATAQPRPASSASLPQEASRAAQGVDALPQAVQNPPPVYPPELLAARIEGRVVLRVLVRTDGSVGDAAVHVSSGRQAFDAAALATIRRWRFTPAMRNGAPVEYSIAAPIRFVIGAAPR